ncbi:MAG: sensor histidine kinase [Luteolibacter sp.]
MKDGTPHRFDSIQKRVPGVDEEISGHCWSLPEVRIVVYYVVLASMWIVGSDLLLTKTVAGENEVGVIQSLKGLNFVLTTGVLLFFVLRRAYGGWRLAEERRLAMVTEARERYRNLSSRIQSLREDDRTRIAREIHDELGQLLTGIKMELRLIENLLAKHPGRSLNPIIDKLVETTGLVDTTISSVQRISAGLRPSALDHLGLSAALGEEADLFSQRAEIPCTIDIHDLALEISPAMATSIFRIFQECLTNVVRHAKAHKVEASFSAEENTLMLTVRDDGIGMDISILNDPQSLGLIGMLERAANIGGSLAVKSHPQKGTEVTLTVPLPEPLALS